MKHKPYIKPFETDFFSIESSDEGKQIHISGNIYPCDDEWRYTEYIFLIVPLNEFIKGMKESEDYLDNLFCDSKQGIKDITEEEAVDYLNHYFDGHSANGTLTYGDITEDTPIGNYITP